MLFSSLCFILYLCYNSVVVQFVAVIVNIYFKLPYKNYVNINIISSSSI